MIIQQETYWINLYEDNCTKIYFVAEKAVIIFSELFIIFIKRNIKNI